MTRPDGLIERRPVMVRMGDSVVKGSHFYLVYWVMPGFAAPLGNHPYAGYPPYIHKDAELLFHITEFDGLILYMEISIDEEKCTDRGVCVSEEYWCPARAFVKA
ncbi:hypothetical protein ACFLUL_00035 [Chloroflexota bacterium]